MACKITAPDKVQRMATAERYLAIAKSIHETVFAGLLDGMYAGLDEAQCKNKLKALIVAAFMKFGYKVGSEQLDKIATDFPLMDDAPDHHHPYEEKIENAEIFRIALLLSQQAFELDNEQNYRESAERISAPLESKTPPDSVAF